MGENEYDRGGAVNDRMSGGGENEIRFHTSGGVSALGMENLSVLHALMQNWQAALLIQQQWKRLLCNQR